MNGGILLKSFHAPILGTGCRQLLETVKAMYVAYTVTRVENIPRENVACRRRERKLALAAASA